MDPEARGRQGHRLLRLTEPDFGSNPGGMRTKARKTQFLGPQRRESVDHDGSIADVAVVWAKVDGAIRGFLVEKGTPGFTTAYPWAILARASTTSQLFSNTAASRRERAARDEGIKYPLGA